MADITELLNRWTDGDSTAFDQMIPLVYSEMRAIARNLMRNERPGHLLDTTALVHDAYLRLVDQTRIQWSSRVHFYGAAANAMRRILVDQARKRLSVKRGSGAIPEELDLGLTIAFEPDLEVVELNQALDELAAIDPERARVVELRYFAGLSLEETAELLDVSPQSVSRDWTAARAWLARRLKGGKNDGGETV